MNQNLSKLGSQLAAIWKQLGAAQRLSVAIATLGLIGGLAGLAFWSSRVEYSLLYGKLSDTESARVISALDEAKVPYKIGTGGSSISVPTAKVHVMRMQLAGKGIPRGDGVGFEIFDKPNFGISDFVQRANYVRAVQGELARTISQIDEIDSARVMIVVPENRLLVDKDKHPTASVFVRVRGNAQLQPQSINSIRFLVANAVEGLRANFVTVVDNMGNVLSENVENDSLVGITTTQLAARRNLEQYLAKKTEGMLEKVLGPGQALVRVAAEINYDTTMRTEEKFDPDGQVVKMQTKDEENNDTTSASPATPVGITTNTGETNANSVAMPVTSTRNKKNTGTTEYEISKSTSNITQMAGGIKRLSAAVTVAARFEGTGTARKIVPRSTEDLDKLRRIVQSALGVEQGEGGTPNNLITLEELAFNDPMAGDVVQQLDKQERTDFWLNIGKMAIYPVLAIVFLAILLRLLKRTPVETIPIGIPLSQFATVHNGNGNGNGHGNGKSMPGVVTVDVLNQLIRENPDNMTQAIRNWMGREKTGQN
ncbi:MAG TPA: flagellar basal-body MS-ring/collar protein FliF [Candidatus Acidoferrum sp.]|nr:flagellar basal-body MS-ring/collar protein FliF [Candidatus Acidoferrum sp.]